MGKFPNWQRSEAELRELRKQVTFALYAEEDDIQKVTTTVEALFTRSVSPSTLAQVGHESADVSQTRSSSGAVYVGPHTFSPPYDYCYVDADGRPVMIHRRRLVFFLPESRPDVNDRTFIETDTCQ